MTSEDRHDIHWTLMFKVNNLDKAKRAAQKAFSGYFAPPELKECNFEQYHKIPELWVCSFTSHNSKKLSADVIQDTLIEANSLGTCWLISGPAFKGDSLMSFEGIFSKETGKTSLNSFEWGQFQIFSS